MSVPESWQGVAYNQATASENRIHADDVAKQYGFRGGLVPGVTVYAYLVQPAIEAWGREWLAAGAADVVLHRPLYDGVGFAVEIERDGPDRYHGAVVDAEGTRCAEGSVSRVGAGEPPARRGVAPAPPIDARPEATRENLEKLRAQDGWLGAVPFEWSAETELDRTSRDLDDMPDLVRLDRGGFANPAFSLGMANHVLSRNVVLGPWIHVSSEATNFAAIARGARLVGEAQIVDLFARKGHEFVDLDVAVFDEQSQPVLRARHRAIYRLRPV